MRLTEEKSLIKIEAILLIFVIFTGIGIQICSNQIDEYNSKILHKSSALNLTENERLGQSINSIRYLLSAFINANVDVNFKEAYKNESLHQDFKKIVKEYESGKISKFEYFNKLSSKHHDVSYALYKKYLSQKNDLSAIITNRPIWRSIRYFLFLLQFIAIFFSILMYVLIHRSINKRIK